MEVGDGFAAVAAIVDDDPVTGIEVLVRCHLSGDEEEVTEQLLVFGGCLLEAWERFDGDNEEVSGGLGIDIFNGEGAVVLIEDFGRDLAGVNFLEEGTGVGGIGHKAVGGMGITYLPRGHP